MLDRLKKIVMTTGDMAAEKELKHQIMRYGILMPPPHEVTYYHQEDTLPLGYRFGTGCGFPMYGRLNGDGGGSGFCGRRGDGAIMGQGREDGDGGEFPWLKNISPADI